MTTWRRPASRSRCPTSTPSTPRPWSGAWRSPTPLRDEEWGVRRFMLREPSGTLRQRRLPPVSPDARDHRGPPPGRLGPPRRRPRAGPEPGRGARRRDRARHLRHRRGDHPRRVRAGRRRARSGSILGHESLGRVREAPDDSGLSPGDLVVGIVRRPDPVPCACCARGEWDFCRNGRYTERGIKEMHGYGSERWRVEPEFAVAPRPGARGRRRAARADERRREGVGADRADRRARAASTPAACS